MDIYTSIYRKLFKSVFDLVSASFVLIVLSPVFILISISIWITIGRPVFFKQERPGINEKAFKLFKFRTMTSNTDKNGNLLPDIDRITSLGAFLRKTSLDEIPQFINIIKGQMSLIGPRPLLYRYIPLYKEKHRLRHSVKPGITGWAQVNGRNSISWNQKFDLDIYYVENLSFILDLKIFFLTIKNVIKKTGINQSKERPMVPFDGTN